MAVPITKVPGAEPLFTFLSQSCAGIRQRRAPTSYIAQAASTKSPDLGAPALSKPLSTLVHDSLTETIFEHVNRSTRYPALDNYVEADVVIVGAGIAGLTTALRLQQSGKQVVVLEARLVGSGNSGRDTGNLTAWKRQSYSSLLSLYDKPTTAAVAESHKHAIDHIEKTSEEEEIKADFRRLDGYVFTYEGQDAETKAQRELSAALDAGLKNVTLCDDVDLGKDCGVLAHALRFPDTAVLNPVRYVEGLADAVTRGGGQIFEDTRVQRANSRSCLMANGYKALAREAVVVTTGVPITYDLIDSSVRAVAVHGKQVPRRRYAVAFRLPEGSANEGVYYELNDPPYVVQVSKAAAGRGLQLVVSGEEHDQGIPAEEYHDFYSRLETWVKAKWPAVESRTHQWSYQIFETSEKLSLHGKDPAPSPDTDFYISHGDSGETLVSAILGGLIISDSILQRPNPFSELYSPGRSLIGPQGLPPVNLTYAANTVKAVAGQLLPRKDPEVADLPPGTGTILQGNITKLAVYKDENGTAHAYSAICPHLGCLLQWNPLEKQWNCPCHGSCFDKRGTNMGGGPSTLDMTAKPGAV